MDFGAVIEIRAQSRYMYILRCPGKELCIQKVMRKVLRHLAVAAAEDSPERCFFVGPIDIWCEGGRARDPQV